MLDPDDSRHGTVNGYINHKCRCPECREANRQEVAKARRRRFLTVTGDDPRHGTDNYYANYGCRCTACVAARAEAVQRRKK